MKLDEYVGLEFWKTAPDDVRTQVRACLTEVVCEHRGELVDAFYSALIHHREATMFLDHSVVQNRLSHSLGAWLEKLVATDLQGDIGDFVALQSRIGMIHARIKVPNHLVMQGVSLLKSRIGGYLVAMDLAPQIRSAALIMQNELIDCAINLMSEAYVTDTRDRAKVDEAFRLFNLGQDINLERETQRAALMEWSHQVLFDLLGSQERADFRPLSSSSFGLWVRHRATLLFPDAPPVASIEQLIHKIDSECLPAIVDSQVRSLDAVAALQGRIEEIKFLLTGLFQAAANLENGRDPLTRTLNRRFLSSVLAREVSLARSNDLPLSVALVDVDHFKRINDRYGHSTGDLVLSHIADALLNAVRSSDFVFRYGVEEFLIAFAETEQAEATRIAQRLCRQFAETPLAIPGHDPIRITVSIGIARFEGHPDYQYLINKADEALYRAKNSGRNRVDVAGKSLAA